MNFKIEVCIFLFLNLIFKNLNAAEGEKKIIIIEEDRRAGVIETWISVDENIIKLHGKISEKSVDALIDASKNHQKISEMQISSGGGDVKAGLRLASWIQARKLDVRVTTVCVSACANYIFLAGEKKTIENGAFVIWHGDVYQKDFRELLVKYDSIYQRNLENDSLSEEEKTYLLQNKLKYDSLRELQKIQTAFYKSIGVNDEIGKIGQEPISYDSDGWTVTLELMEFYGVKNVHAPAGYARGSYFSRDPLASLLNKGPLLVLDINQEKTIYPLPPPPPAKRRAPPT